VLITHNRMLEALIAQKVSFSSIPLNRLLSKPEPNPHEHCNCVTLKEEVEDLTDPEDMPMEKGTKIIMAGSKERNNDGETATLVENDTIEVPTVFST